MSQDYTICALLYGDFPDLAARCLSSIVQLSGSERVAEIRIGLNVVSEKSRACAQNLMRGLNPEVRFYEPDRNALKYPLMRQMFYGCGIPIQTPYVMWFDDDSCLAPAVSSVADWWNRLHARIQEADMLGSLWWLMLEGSQAEAIRNQPWYTGKPWLRLARDGQMRDAMAFATGGWWTARMEAIRKLDYPWPELKHRGGDALLGEALRQQDKKVVAYDHGLWINANQDGRSFEAKKRGFDSKPLWFDYVAGKAPDLSHQEFILRTKSLKDKMEMTVRITPAALV